MATIETTYRKSARPGHGIPPSAASRCAAASMTAWVARQIAKRNSRLALLELSDEMLADIGVSRFDADCEARRWFYE